MSAQVAGRPLLTELYPRIVKPRAGLRVPPNLADYDAACRGFTWAAARAQAGRPAGRPGPEHRARGGGSPRRRTARRPRRTALARPHRGAARPHLSRPARGDQPVRQRPAQLGRRGGRKRLRAGRPHPRTVHRRARRPEGEMRRLAAVLGVRPGAAGDPARASAPGAFW